MLFFFYILGEKYSINGVVCYSQRLSHLLRHVPHRSDQNTAAGAGSVPLHGGTLPGDVPCALPDRTRRGNTGALLGVSVWTERRFCLCLPATSCSCLSGICLCLVYMFRDVRRCWCVVTNSKLQEEWAAPFAFWHFI